MNGYSNITDKYLIKSFKKILNDLSIEELKHIVQFVELSVLPIISLVDMSETELINEKDTQQDYESVYTKDKTKEDIVQLIIDENFKDEEYEDKVKILSNKDKINFIAKLTYSEEITYEKVIDLIIKAFDRHIFTVENTEKIFKKEFLEKNDIAYFE